MLPAYQGCTANEAENELLHSSQDLYSHQKLNMYIYWFSSESGYRRWRRRQRRTP